MNKTSKYVLTGLDCADCALHVEKGVARLPGVQNARVDFATATLHIEGSITTEVLRKRVQSLGYDLALPVNAERTPTNFFHFLLKRTDTRLALVGGLFLLISLLLNVLNLDALLVTILQITALVVAGFPIARSAVMNLVINRGISINLLMTLAAIGAVIIGESTEAAVLIFLFALSEALEGYTTERSRRALHSMAELAPQKAVRLVDGTEEIVSIEALRVGDHLLIRPGERVPMDGKVINGESQVNQAPITGESMPVMKTLHDTVFAGGINGTGALEIEVTHLAADNTLNRIYQLALEAQERRAPVQRAIDQFARYYTPAVVGLAFLTAVIPPLFFGQPFWNPSPEVHGWLYRALSLLVISCPCALVISAPVTILSGITAAARSGVLIKGGAYLEALSKIKLFAFDKTGTLTRGQPVVTLHRSVNCATGSDCAECDRVLALASALERRSTHPLAAAILSAAQERGLDNLFSPARQVVALSGSGLQGQVEGSLVTIGRHAYFDESFPHEDVLCDWVQAAENRGQTTMLVASNEQVCGFIAAADEIRPETAGVINALKSMGAQTALLSGDNEIVAEAVAKQAGIDTFRANLLPADKLAAIHQMQAATGPTAMVGDGINDTPALAAASVGIAMGGAGSAQALEAADIVLLADGLSQLPIAFKLARFTQQIIWQNIIISLMTKLVFIGLALGGITSLWLAVLADTGVSLLVTTNGMRPLLHTKTTSPVQQL